MSAPNQAIQNTSNPAEYAAAVTLSDSTVLTPTPRALYIGVGGDVVVTMAADGSDIVGVVTDDDAGNMLKALPEYQADSREALAALHPAADIRCLDILLQSPPT